MLEAGDIITLTAGAWRLREPLASSSYGLLWHAEPAGGGPPAVLKLVNTEQMALALPPQRVRWPACLRAEIAFLGALRPWDQRHIVRLLDSGWHDGLPVLALELMSTDLGKHMAALPVQWSRWAGSARSICCWLINLIATSSPCGPLARQIWP